MKIRYFIKKKEKETSTHHHHGIPKQNSEKEKNFKTQVTQE
jgi:hypothetical protein